jgi:hypothetical protein
MPRLLRRATICQWSPRCCDCTCGREEHSLFDHALPAQQQGRRLLTRRRDGSDRSSRRWPGQVVKPGQSHREAMAGSRVPSQRAGGRCGYYPS